MRNMIQDTRSVVGFGLSFKKIVHAICEILHWQRERVLLFLFLSLAAFFLYLPSENVSAMAIAPDSSEYSMGLVNLFEHGIFGFTLNGVWYPSRYTPWFSLSCLMPAYLLSGGNPLCFHWSILVFALAVMLLVVKWGERMGLGKWSLVTVPLLLVLPDFAFYSRIVLTEIPYVAIFAASSLFWLRFVRRGQKVSLKLCLITGVLIAWGGMVRPTMLPMLTPFAVVIWMQFPWRGRFQRLMTLVAPSVLYEVLNLCYNKFVFGSYFRSGYQYWAPVPCDFPHLLFSWENVCQNVRELLWLPGYPVMYMTVVMMLVSLIFSVLVLRGGFGGYKQNSVFFLLLGYLFFQLCVLVALYGGYYWTDTRFYLSITVCAVPLFLYSCQRMVSRLPVRLSSLFFIIIIVLLGKGFLSSSPMYPEQPRWNQARMAKGRIASRVIPEKSVVTQLGNPSVLEYLEFRQHQLMFFPYMRWYVYEFNMIAPFSIRNRCHPISANHIYISELIERGICKTPFPKTLNENPEQVQKYISEGKRIFVEQEVFGGERDLLAFQQRIKKVGLTMKYFGVWSVPALKPNPIRHYYDSLVLGGCKMDSRPEVSATYHEIVRLEEVVQ